MAKEVLTRSVAAVQEADKESRLETLEASLRQRELELEEAQRIARLGTFRWDFLADVVTWSPEVYLAYGLDPGQPVPRRDDSRRMHKPESWSRLVAAIERTKTTGEPYAIDLQLEPGDGPVRWVTIRGEAAGYGANGEVVAIRGTVQNITERKLAEAQIAQSEARYRALVKACADIVWISSPEGEQLNEIPEWEAFTGQTTEQVLGFGWADAVHPDDRQSMIETWLGAVKGGSANEVSHRHRVRRHDGVYRCMQARAVASRDAEGKVTEWVGMHTDITAQIEAERALRETQSRFQRLYDAKLMGICYPDRFGRFRDSNDEFLRIVGFSREEMEAGLVRWDAMTPPEYAELDAQHIAEAAERGSCTPYEKEYIRKDGTRVPILCGYALLEGSSDEYIGFVTDLTAQKAAEQAVREQEQSFQELADSLPQLVWVSDPNGDRIYTNKYYLDYLGLPLPEVLGGAWKDYLHPDDVERTLKRWMRCMETGEPYLNEYRIRRHDGVYRSFLVRGVPVRNEAGEIQRWLGSATDIHDQKLSEETLRRTEKLAATGRMAASIAHEINNPLEAVTNSLYLALHDDSLREDTRTYLKMAEQELSRVAHVTTQTLQFHRQSVAPSEADLGELMDSAYGLFAPRFLASSVTVEREYGREPRLYCRGDEIRQVFANLLSNALDATRKGGRVRIRIRRSHSWGPEACHGLRVSVADTGHGIPDELRKKIFEPFISTKETTGTGLGLWVSDGIVRKHRGRISLRSRTAGEHRGTLFSLFFPFDGIQSANSEE